GMLVVRQAVLGLFHSLDTSAVVCRESLIWLCAIVLLIVVRRGEHLPFKSIGIGTRPFARSASWGGLIAFVCGLAGFGIAALTHFNGGRSGESLAKLPIWLILAVVIRAGVVEELFYRGYAIERLRSVGLNQLWAVAI